MILLDFSGILEAKVHTCIKLTGGFNPDDYYVMVLGHVAGLNKKFKKEYGKLIICLDAPSSTYWRKDIFPDYKYPRKDANKKQKAKNADIDWDVVYEAKKQIKNDLEKYFPFKLIGVPTAEADDIIGVISKYCFNQEKILIISEDRDFIQLINKNVSLYHLRKNKMIKLKR